MTLVEDQRADCWGIAFEVDSQDAQGIFDALDLRESGGYVRITLPIEFADASSALALTYYAPPENDNFLGPAPISKIAQQVHACSGDSGHNVDYVLRLASALRKAGIRDDEVEALEVAVRRLVGNP